MKIPSLRSIERIVKMVPVVKDLLPNNESESGSQIQNLKDALHNKNADIFKLRQKIKRMKRLLFSNNEKIKDLEQTLDITEELRTEAEVKLGKAGYREL